jgi:hypothetical protein
MSLVLIDCLFGVLASEVIVWFILIFIIMVEVLAPKRNWQTTNTHDAPINHYQINKNSVYFYKNAIY